MINLEPAPNCVICGIKGKELYNCLEDRRFNVNGGYNLKTCSQCGLIWLDPRPQLQEIHKCYENYFVNTNNVILPEAKGPLASVKKFLQTSLFCGHYGYRHLHRKHIFCKLGHFLSLVPILNRKAIYGLGNRFPAFKNDEFILDIGCGDGEYLQLMKKLGWKVLGIEPDPVAAKILERNDIPVKNTTFLNAEIADSTVYQIAMNHSLEHIPDPEAVIKKCFRILKPGGKLTVITPNAGSFGHKFFKESWFALDSPRHLFVFSVKSISLLFRNSPFKDFRIATRPRMASYIYNASMAAREHKKIGINPVPPRKGNALFVFTESLLCNFGFRCGEEIEIVAKKPL